MEKSKDFKEFLWEADRFYEGGERQKAIVYYDRALSLDPNQSNVYDKKGNALMAMKKYKEAVKSYNKAISLNPSR